MPSLAHGTCSKYPASTDCLLRQSFNASLLRILLCQGQVTATFALTFPCPNQLWHIMFESLISTEHLSKYFREFKVA